MIGRESHVGDDLTAFLDGALPAPRRAEVESHLDGCAGCRALRDELARALSVISALPPPPAPAAGFEQRFYARLAREAPVRRSLLDRFLGHPLRWLVPATGLAATLLVGAWVREGHERNDLELARHLDLLESYVEVASLDAAVQTPEDVDVVLHLDELAGTRP